MNEKAQRAIKAVKNYKVARTSILLIAALGLLNVILYLAGADFYFPFSVTFPYCAVIFGDLFAAELGSKALFIIMAILAFVILGVYVLMFFLSKDHKGCLIATLVLYAIDLAFVIYLMVAGKSYTMVIDLIFHGAVLYEFIMGIKGASLLAAYPQGIKVTAEEILAAEGVNGQVVEGADNTVTVVNDNAEPVVAADYSKPDSAVIRESDGKGNVFVSATNGDAKIEFRKKMNMAELIIDGKVLCERKGLPDAKSYTLEAVYRGVTYKAVQTRKFSSVTAEIYAEDKQLASKTQNIF